jgi:hypothetical protein
LSPDLRSLFEQAEKLAEDDLHKRAYKVFKKLEEFLPGDAYIVKRLRELQESERGAVGPVAEGSVNTSLISPTEMLLKDLLRDLEIDEIRQGYGDLSPMLKGVEALDDIRFRRVAMDVSVFAGLSNNWHFALECLERLRSLGDETQEILLWKLRCLVELEKFAEGVALFTAQLWSDGHLIHANFLVGLAYEGLGVRDQAKQRFEAVHKLDPGYRKVSQKLLNY